jgi:hypothetical protein
MIWYFDLENGNDLWGGDSFALENTGSGTLTSSSFVASSQTTGFTTALIGRSIMLTTRGAFLITAVPNSTTLTLSPFTYVANGSTIYTSTTLTNGTYTFNIGGRWKTPNNSVAFNTLSSVMPNDTIRVMASPAPVSTGITSNWQDSDSGRFYESTKTSNVTTNTTPVSITTTTAHGFQTGDWVFVTAVSVSTPINNLWRITVTGTTTFTLDGSTAPGTTYNNVTVGQYRNKVVELTGTTGFKVIDRAVGTGISAAWTAVSPNTIGSAGTMKDPAGQFSVVCSGTAAGKLAYRTLPSTLDLSAYQQISLQFKTASSNTPANFSLRLCSDTTGDVPVTTIPLPAGSVNAIYPVVFDNGSALPSGINSVAIYRDSGSFVSIGLQVCNIVAVVAPSNAKAITHASLIGKANSIGAGGDDSEAWWPVASFWDNGSGGKCLLIDQDSNFAHSSANNQSATRGYTGVTATGATLYRRECIRSYALGLGTSGSILIRMPGRGPSPAPKGSGIQISGGWNRTDMSTQQTPAQTYIDHSGHSGFTLLACDLSNTSMVVTGLSAVRFSTTLTMSQASTQTINIESAVGSGTLSWSGTGSQGSDVTFTFINAFSSGGVSMGASFDRDSSLTIKNYISNGGQGASAVFQGFSGEGNLYLGVVRNCNGNGPILLGAGRGRIIGTTLYDIWQNFSSNQLNYFSTAGVNTSVSGSNECYWINTNVVTANYFGAVDPLKSITPNASMATNPTIHFQNFKINGVSQGNVSIFDGGSIQEESTIVHTAGGKSRKVTLYWSTTSNLFQRGSAYPYPFRIARVAAVSGVPITVSVWVRRETSLAGASLVCPGNQFAGPVATSTATASAATGTWEQLSVTVTPTDNAVLYFAVNVWATGTSSSVDQIVYVDDVSVTGGRSGTDAGTLDYYGDGAPVLANGPTSGSTKVPYII